jgi:putative membrane protein
MPPHLFVHHHKNEQREKTMKTSKAAAILLTVGLLIFLGGRASAQNSNSSTTSGPSQSMSQSMMLSSMDKKFMMDAAMGGKAEVAMAQLALERASSDAVKQYAQKMIDDHTKAGEELMQVASMKGITLPMEPDAKHKALLAKMQGLSGAEFNSLYIKMAGVQDHQKMEKLFMSESAKGKDADAKGFAAKTLPTVQEHLRMAREMTTSMMSGKKGMSMSH